jgi:hypothetical protein
MCNPETLETLDTQDTEQRPPPQKKKPHTTQKNKNMSNLTKKVLKQSNTIQMRVMKLINMFYVEMTINTSIPKAKHIQDVGHFYFSNLVFTSYSNNKRVAQ